MIDFVRNSYHLEEPAYVWKDANEGDVAEYGPTWAWVEKDALPTGGWKFVVLVTGLCLLLRSIVLNTVVSTREQLVDMLIFGYWDT